ncbi:MAG: hypothetical protein IVW52_05210 [Acidimicrobiales bacterium]|nr:hypothetical protein [Acidimicrobiales bacterium]
MGTSFSGGGHFPPWQWGISNDWGCGQPSNSAAWQSMSFSATVQFHEQNEQFVSPIWFNTSVSGSGFNIWAGCTLTNNDGTLSPLSVVTCAGGAAEYQAISWDPSFTQYGDYPPFPQSTAKYNVNVGVCGSGSISLSVTWNQDTFVNYGDIAYDAIDFAIPE